MKNKLIAVTAVAFLALSCNDGNDNDANSVDSSYLTTNYDSIVNTASMQGNRNSSSAYVPMEGDVTYKNGKVLVYHKDDYVESNEDVMLDNKIMVRKNGEVTREGKTVKLKEGESVDRSGNFFNRAGEGIQDAWNATKTGVKKAGKAVKKAGGKVGEEVKDAFQ